MNIKSQESRNTIVGAAAFMTAMVAIHNFMPHQKAEAVAGQLNELQMAFKEYLAAEKARSEAEKEFIEQQRQYYQAPQQWIPQQQAEPYYKERGYYPPQQYQAPNTGYREQDADYRYQRQ